jgi:hypothetical protein
MQVAINGKMVRGTFLFRTDWLFVLDSEHWKHSGSTYGAWDVDLSWPPEAGAQGSHDASNKRSSSKKASRPSSASAVARAPSAPSAATPPQPEAVGSSSQQPQRVSSSHGNRPVQAPAPAVDDGGAGGGAASQATVPRNIQRQIDRLMRKAAAVTQRNESTPARSSAATPPSPGGSNVSGANKKSQTVIVQQPAPASVPAGSRARAQQQDGASEMHQRTPGKRGETAINLDGIAPARQRVAAVVAIVLHRCVVALQGKDATGEAAGDEEQYGSRFDDARWVAECGANTVARWAAAAFSQNVPARQRFSLVLQSMLDCLSVSVARDGADVSMSLSSRIAHSPEPVANDFPEKSAIAYLFFDRDNSPGWSVASRVGTKWQLHSDRVTADKFAINPSDGFDHVVHFRTASVGTAPRLSRPSSSSPPPRRASSSTSPQSERPPVPAAPAATAAPRSRSTTPNGTQRPQHSPHGRLAGNAVTFVPELGLRRTLRDGSSSKSTVWTPFVGTQPCWATTGAIILFHAAITHRVLPSVSEPATLANFADSSWVLEHGPAWFVALVKSDGGPYDASAAIRDALDALSVDPSNPTRLSSLIAVSDTDAGPQLPLHGIAAFNAHHAHWRCITRDVNAVWHSCDHPHQCAGKRRIFSSADFANDTLFFVHDRARSERAQQAGAAP